MKNKKFLLTIAMIMSLVMAVSCGDTPTDSNAGGNGGSGGSQPSDKKDLSITLAENEKAFDTKTTTLLMKKGNATPGIGFTITLAGEDMSKIKTETGTVIPTIESITFATTDEMNTTAANPNQALNTKKIVTKPLLKSTLKVETTSTIGQIKLSFENDGWNFFFESSNGELKTANDFTAAKIKVKFTDKENKKNPTMIEIPVVFGNKN